MTNTYTWKIVNLDRYSIDDFVYQAHYTVSAVTDQVDADGVIYPSVKTYGCVSLDRPSTLVAFEDLTEAEIIASVQAKLGGSEKVIEIQDQLAARIAKQIAPTQISGKPFSW